MQENSTEPSPAPQEKTLKGETALNEANCTSSYVNLCWLKSDKKSFESHQIRKENTRRFESALKVVAPIVMIVLLYKITGNEWLSAGGTVVSNAKGLLAMFGSDAGPPDSCDL